MHHKDVHNLQTKHFTVVKH